jgi:hypothetical protein
MPFCNACGHYGPEDDFPELTEEDVFAAAVEGTIDNPTDFREALENLGPQCSQCGAMNIEYI